jgi:spore maturation protein CgeB
VAAARAYRAEMLIWLTQSLRQEVLEELRHLGVQHIVAWWGDTPANMQGLGLLADGWDRVFIKDAAAVKKLRTVGIDAELLHEAMNPTWHNRCLKKINLDTVIAGNLYGYRQFLAKRLIDSGLPIRIYGPPPPRWTYDTVKRAHSGNYIVREEKARIFGEGLACLNSTAFSEGDSLNCRAFEIAGCCGLQLLEDKPSVASCFEPETEVLIYRSVDDIVGFAEHAKCEPSWAMGIRESGYRRAHAHHTYEHRLRTIFESLGLTA